MITMTLSVPIRGLFNLTAYDDAWAFIYDREMTFRPHQGII